jgi:hypothetical protein
MTANASAFVMTQISMHREAAFMIVMTMEHQLSSSLSKYVGVGQCSDNEYPFLLRSGI